MKNISILGSTGSVGTQTLEIVRANNDLKVVAIAAKKNIKKLEEQIREFDPEIVCVYDEDAAEQLKISVADKNVKIVTGMDGLIEAATYDKAKLVVTAFVGMIGIIPTLECIKAGKDIALANKETLVTAGHLVMNLAKKHNVKILPVDSEHSAIFQSINGENHKEIDKIILTASGGPFRTWEKSKMKNVTIEDALKHPNWKMGPKITIDSATMVNKGLEVLEAKWLFDVDVDDVQIVIQPQSIIHSMVQFNDGAVMAQLGLPDMKLPIQYAIYYPERRYLAGEKADFGKIAQITFEDPDFEKFKGLSLAYRAGKIGGSMPTVLNAANEKAVAMFLNRQISFLEITEIIEYCMSYHQTIHNPTVQQILDIEQWVDEIVDKRW